MMRARLLTLGALAALALASPAAAEADFSGIWQVPRYEPTVKTVEGQLPPFRPEAAAKYKASVDAQERGEPIADSSTQCLPHGVPRVMYAPYPLQFLQTPGQVSIVMEVNHMFRLVYLNEKLPPLDELDQTYLGQSVGRWEGDTLVIETAGFNDKTLIDRAGIPHSVEMKVTERLRKIDANTIEYLATIDDPKTFTRPWTMRNTFKKHPPDFRLMEYVCAENNRPVLQETAAK